MSEVTLRGHHLLCIQGFRGHGYSQLFVTNMTNVVEGLRRRPEDPIEIAEGPDAICIACPHRGDDGCQKRNDQSETRVRQHDERVLARLALTFGDRLEWADILERIRSNLKPEDLGELCGDCEWLSLGLCQEGVAALASQPGALPARSTSIEASQ